MAELSALNFISRAKLLPLSLSRVMSLMFTIALQVVDRFYSILVTAADELLYFSCRIA